MTKDDSILTLLQKLQLEACDWTVVDHWEADLCALGIARCGRPRHLVYVSTYEKGAGRYAYACEAPAGSDETDFVVSAKADDASFDELVAAIEKHLTE